MKCKTLSLLNSHRPQTKTKDLQDQDRGSSHEAKTMTKTFKFQYRDVSKQSLKSWESQAWL